MNNILNSRTIYKLIIPSVLLSFILISYVGMKVYFDNQTKKIRISKSLIEKYNEDVKLSDYILLKSYNVNKYDKGGFFWWVNQVAALVKLGEMTNKRVIVLFDDGYYIDPTRTEKSWFNYYFKYPKLTKKHLDLIEASDIIGYEEVLSSKLPDTDKMYLFTNKTFRKVMKGKMGNQSGIFKRFLKLEDSVVDECRNFLSESSIILDNDTWMLGVHYRGTDKFMANNDTENMKENRHTKYEDVIKVIKKELAKKPKDKKRVYIYAASDEKPFVDMVKREFGDIVKSYDAFRVDVSTSGMTLDNDKSVKTNDNSKQGKKLMKLANMSIHRGDNGVSGFKKGLDAVMDVWMLSKCNTFIKTHNGNFSGQPKKWNDSLKVVDISEMN